jgi:hypothetical protein
MLSNQNNKYLKNEEKFFFMISAQMKSKVYYCINHSLNSQIWEYFNT